MKKIRRRKIRNVVAGAVLLVALSAAFIKLLTGTLEQSDGDDTVASIKSINVDAVETVGASYNSDAQTESKDYSDSVMVSNEQDNVSLAGSAYLNVSWISQYPELPTGCEITSLTTVLQYYGYNVSKTTMARQYLETGSGSFFDLFVGSPFSSMGYGCMAQPITNAANKYFSAKKISATAENVSGSDFTELLAYVSGGDPVIIWNTMYMAEPYISESWYEDGELISWVAPEHCVVLIGYDLDKNEVYVSDPLEGIMTRDLSLFAEYYEAMYAQAVVIQR